MWLIIGSRQVQVSFLGVWIPRISDIGVRRSLVQYANTSSPSKHSKENDSISRRAKNKYSVCWTARGLYGLVASHDITCSNRLSPISCGITSLKQDHHHSDHQTARRHNTLCSICGHRSGSDCIHGNTHNQPMCCILKSALLTRFCQSLTASVKF